MRQSPCLIIVHGFLSITLYGLLLLFSHVPHSQCLGDTCRVSVYITGSMPCMPCLCHKAQHLVTSSSLLACFLPAAGLTYSLTMVSIDVYGNVQLNAMPTINAAFVAACTTFNTAMPNGGGDGELVPGNRGTVSLCCKISVRLQ